MRTAMYGMAAWLALISPGHGDEPQPEQEDAAAAQQRLDIADLFEKFEQARPAQIEDAPDPELVRGRILESIDGIQPELVQVQPTVTVPDDHPRLAQFIKQGIVHRAAARNWGCEQASGEPNTEGAGDIVTSWASATQDGQDEWLELTYEKAVKPVEVHVVETYNPGALFKVTAVTESGMDAVLWKGEDPTAKDAAEGRGTSIVKVSAGIKTNRIRIHLASKDVPGWNEIDAVGVKDDAGKMHWAKSVTASSNYAGGPEPGWMLDPAAALKYIESLEAEVERLQGKEK